MNVDPVMRHETPMLLSAEPLLHRPPVKVERRTTTGRSRCWSSTRTAAPPTSGPVRSQRLSAKVESTIVSRPPRTKTAPPPPPSVVSPVLLPRTRRIRFSTSRGSAWSLQCDVVQTCARSQVFM